MAVYKGSKLTDLYAYFVALSQQVKGVNFVYYDSEEYDTTMANPPRNRLIVHRGDPKRFPPQLFEGKTYLEMLDFIIGKSYPEPVEANPKVLDMVHDNDIPALVLSCPVAEECQKYLNIVGQASIGNHTMVKVFRHGSANGNGDEGERKKPQVSIMDVRRGKNHHHIMRDEVTVETVEAFVRWYFDRRKNSRHLSEHSECLKSHVVRKITGHNYEKEVIGTEKVIVILVHDHSEDQEKLLKSFEETASWVHSKLPRIVKFRTLNQRKNTTPLKFYESPVLLVVLVNYRHDPEMFIEEEVSIEEGISKYQMYKLLQRKAHFGMNPFVEEMQQYEKEEDIDL